MKNKMTIIWIIAIILLLGFFIAGSYVLLNYKEPLEEGELVDLSKIPASTEVATDQNNDDLGLAEDESLEGEGMSEEEANDVEELGQNIAKLHAGAELLDEYLSIVGKQQLRFKICDILALYDYPDIVDFNVNVAQVYNDKLWMEFQAVDREEIILRVSYDATEQKMMYQLIDKKKGMRRPDLFDWPFLTEN